MTPSTPDTPKKQAAKALDDTIAHFNSTAHKRVALRRMLEKSPDNEQVLKELKRLSGPDFIKWAAKEGIYMCYSRADELFALEMHDTLTDAGIEVWLDMIDVPDDRDWHMEVAAAQTKSGLMIAILSPEAIEEDVLQEEREQFNQTGKLILPVMHRQCDYQPPQDWLAMIDCSKNSERGLYLLQNLLQEQKANVI